MLHAFHNIAVTPAVKELQTEQGSRAAYAKFDSGPVINDRLGPAEAAFIAARDGFYIASVSETGWPYIQFRGGPPGFLRVIDERTLGFADFRGNRQYFTAGNVTGENRVSMFLMDYGNQRRLKLFGRAQIREAEADPELAASLADPAYRATVERSFLIHVEAFDWNCPQHITPRYSADEVRAATAPLLARLAELEERLASQAAAEP
jgi:predicted pyridoxine 5'-phosphate oxidase superfamily flavin-nucleotide-binding protein